MVPTGKYFESDFPVSMIRAIVCRLVARAPITIYIARRSFGDHKITSSSPLTMLTSHGDAPKDTALMSCMTGYKAADPANRFEANMFGQRIRQAVLLDMHIPSTYNYAMNGGDLVTPSHIS
jgi:hypothetical protein